MKTATNPVLNFAQELCTVLTEDYNHQYPQGQDLQFQIEVGRKYFKINQCEKRNGSDQYSSRSVHAFVDKKTGDVYKPASWKAPAKHVRFDMRIIRDREFLHNPDNVGWAGGYLYMI